MVDRKRFLTDDAFDLLLGRQSYVLEECTRVLINDSMVAVAIHHIAHDFVDLGVLHKFALYQPRSIPFLLKVEQEVNVHLQRILEIATSNVVLTHQFSIEFGLMLLSQATELGVD
jgi:hypothetical protein